MFKNMIALYSKVEVGTTLTFINGGDASVITTIHLPNKEIYKHLKARIELNKKQLVILKHFVKNLNQGNRVLGAADVPSVIHEIGRHHPDITDIVLMNISPYYDNAPALNMTEGLVPSDQFILSSRAHSPFGTQGLNTLSGKRVHWLIAEPIGSSLLHEKISRFWLVYLNQLEAKTLSFTHNIESVLNLMLSDAQAINVDYELDKSGKFEMQSIRTISASKSIYEQQISDTTLPPRALDNKQAVTLGIEWQGDVDLDIYAEPFDGEVLYFGNVRSKDGRFFKDIRSGTENKTLYETTELNAVNIRKLRVAVNVYSVKAPPIKPIKGTLRVKIGKHVYAKAFEFSAKTGNKGRDIKNVLSMGTSSAHSQYFNLADMFSS